MKKRKPRPNRELYWSARMGLSQWTTDDIREVEARRAEVLAKKLAAPPMIHNVPLIRLGARALQMPAGARLNGITLAKL